MGVSDRVREQLLSIGVSVDPTCVLGEGVRFEQKVVLFNQVTARDCQFGAYSYVGPYGHVLFADVGRYCSIGNNASIGTSAHPLSAVSTSPAFYQELFGPARWAPQPFDVRGARTTVGCDVWIGAHAHVLDGVSIGDGAIVGLGTVVPKDVPAFAIVVGNPARVVRYRFDDAVRDRLTALRWWDYDWPASPLGGTVDWRDPAESLDRIERLIGEGEVPALPGPAVEIRTGRSGSAAA